MKSSGNLMGVFGTMGIMMLVQYSAFILSPRKIKTKERDPSKYLMEINLDGDTTEGTKE